METKQFSHDQLIALKELLVERMVDNMSTKDLVRYVTDDMSEYVRKLSDVDFLEECNNYWDDGLDDIIDEVKDYE